MYYKKPLRVETVGHTRVVGFKRGKTQGIKTRLVLKSEWLEWCHKSCRPINATLNSFWHSTISRWNLSIHFLQEKVEHHLVNLFIANVTQKNLTSHLRRFKPITYWNAIIYGCGSLSCDYSTFTFFFHIIWRLGRTRIPKKWKVAYKRWKILTALLALSCFNSLYWSIRGALCCSHCWAKFTSRCALESTTL